MHHARCATNWHLHGRVSGVQLHGGVRGAVDGGEDRRSSGMCCAICEAATASQATLPVAVAGLTRPDTHRAMALAGGGPHLLSQECATG